MKITLIRHPQTEANERKIIYGKSDYPYTEKGKAQFNYVIEYIKISYRPKPRVRLLTSPSSRTKLLATKIGEILLTEAIVDSRVAEMDFGIFEGITLDEAKIKYPQAYDNFRYHFDTTSIPDGEPYSSFIHRIEQLIEEIKVCQMGKEDDHGHIDEIMIITHGAIIREFLERILVLGEGMSWKFIIGNGCIVKLEYLGDSYRLKELLANTF